MAKKYTIASTKQIIRVNEHKWKLNQKMAREMYDRLDPEGVHICVLAFPHNDVHMRTVWLVKETEKEEPTEAMIDMTFEDYRELPTVTTEQVQRWKCEAESKVQAVRGEVVTNGAE